MTPDKVQRWILIEGLADYVGLWTVAFWVRDELGLAKENQDAVRAESLRLLEPLLLGGYIAVGDSPYRSVTRFDVWDLDPKDAIERIEREWRRLGKEPGMNDICWFTNLAPGDDLAKNLAVCED
jgi:hypothetical protein